MTHLLFSIMAILPDINSERSIAPSVQAVVINEEAIVTYAQAVVTSAQVVVTYAGAIVSNDEDMVIKGKAVTNGEVTAIVLVSPKLRVRLLALEPGVTVNLPDQSLALCRNNLRSPKRSNNSPTFPAN
jgi:hypothetical protein